MSKSRRERARARAAANAAEQVANASPTPGGKAKRQGPSAFTRSAGVGPIESALLQRMSLLNGTGITFEGKRDIYAALGYKKTLVIQDFRGRVQRNGIAAQVNEAMPKACWRGKGELIEDESVDVTTQFEAGWNTFADKCKPWGAFERADISAGIGKYSCILIGAPGKLAEEIVKGTPIDKVQFLAVYEEDQARIDTEDLEYDTESPNFGLPRFYSLNLPAATGGSNFQKVHASRVVHVADNVTSNQLIGEPRLLRVWNMLDDLEKITGAGSEAFWQRANQGYQFNIDSDAEIDEIEEAQMREQMDEFMHNQRRYLRTRKVNVDTFGADVADFDKNVDTIMSLIAGSSGIPKRILLGSESAELASTQDKHNWDRRVMDRRESFCEMACVRQLVDRLITYGMLPKPKSYRVDWPQSDDMTIADRATVAAQWADLNNKAGEIVVTGNEIRDKVLGLEPLDEGENTPIPVVGASGFKGVDKANPTPPWQDVHTVADARVDDIQRTALSCLNSGRKVLDLPGLIDAYERHDREHADYLVMQAVDATEDAMQARLVEQLTLCMVAGANAAAARAARSGGFLLRSAAKKKKAPVDVGLSFDADHPAAVAWAQQHAADLVVGVSDLTRVAIRNVITQAFIDGVPPRVAAREIATLIGLTDRDAQAVIALRERLLSAGPGTLVKAGNVRIRVPLTGLTEDVIDLRVSQYAGRLLRARALNIARTETLAAANAGQTQMWRTAQTMGLLRHDATRVWLVTPDDRLCPECAQMNGQVRGVNEPFMDPAGASLDSPPLHSSCRCATGIASA